MQACSLWIARRLWKLGARLIEAGDWVLDRANALVRFGRN